MGAALFQKRLQALLCFFLALRDRRRQRFGGEACGRIAAGNARQHVGDGEVRERRITGNTLGEFDRFGQAGAVIDEILRQPDRFGLLQR